MSFVVISLIVLTVVLAAGSVIAISLYQIAHPPKKIISLTPEAFDIKMRELENRRLDSLSTCTTQEGIDVINNTFDDLKDGYKIGR